MIHERHLPSPRLLSCTWPRSLFMFDSLTAARGLPCGRTVEVDGIERWGAMYNLAGHLSCTRILRLYCDDLNLGALAKGSIPPHGFASGHIPIYLLFP